MDTIKIKRGLKQDLPTRLALGEPAFCTDTYELFIGMGESQPPKAIRDPRFSDGMIQSVLNIEERTGDLEISRDELNRICGELVAEMESIANDVYTKTYTDLITQTSPVMSVPKNVVSGGYKNVLIKGKTFVNLAITNSAKDSITTTSNYKEERLTSINNLKPNTVYTLYFRLNKSVDTVGNYTRADLTLDGTAFLHNISTELTMGHNYIVTTFSLQDHHYEDGFTNLNLRPVSSGTSVLPPNSKATYGYNVVLVEGDYSHLDLDYFEGVCSVKNPYVLNTNGNMFTKTMYTQSMTFDSNNAKLVAYAKVQKGEDYRVTFQYLKSISTGNHGGVALVLTNCVPWDKIGAWYINNTHPGIEKVLSLAELTEVNMDCSFRPVEKEQYVAIYVGIATSSDYDYTATVKNLYLGKTSNTFIESKYNKVKPSSLIILRSLPDGTCDTYNPITGEYISYIEEVELNKSNSYTHVGSDSRISAVRTPFTDTNVDVLNGNISPSRYYCVCNSASVSLQHAWNTNMWSVDTEIGVNSNNQPGNLEIIFKPSTGVTSLAEFQTWITKNYIKVLYRRKTPIITYITPLTPQVYENGYIQVGSDSITPTIEYQLPTSIGSRLDQLQNSVAQLQHFSSNLTEHGTWDVELYSGDTKIVLNPSSYGRYYRVGKSVTIFGKIIVADMSNAPSTGSRYFNIRGIPFSQAGAGATMNFSLVRNLNIETSYQISGYGYSNVIDLLRFNQGSSYSALTPNNVSGGNLEFCFSMTYITNQ